RIEDVENRIEDDLANDLGNLLNRMTALAEKYLSSEALREGGCMTIVPSTAWDKAASDLRDESWNTVQDFSEHMNDHMFHQALARLWKFISLTNAYFHGQEPWK